jgi:hypothetical protein
MEGSGSVQNNDESGSGSGRPQKYGSYMDPGLDPDPDPQHCTVDESEKQLCISLIQNNPVWCIWISQEELCHGLIYLFKTGRTCGAVCKGSHLLDRETRWMWV